MFARVEKIYVPLLKVRPYCSRYGGSRQITEVKQRRTWGVIGACMDDYQDHHVLLTYEGAMNLMIAIGDLH